MIIDILVVGSGPAALGLMLNSIKTDRYLLIILLFFALFLFIKIII